VNDFLNRVEQLVSDSRRLRALLTLEKQRRGIAGDRLLFVGVSNVASVRWCPMKAVLWSRAEELMFFSAYLSDRLVYGHLLGLQPRRQDHQLLFAGRTRRARQCCTPMAPSTNIATAIPTTA
jgi:hypothetical protein